MYDNPMSDTKKYSFVSDTRTTYLINVDPKANSAVILVPISAMVMVVTIAVIIAMLVPITVPVLVAIMRLRLNDSSEEEGGKEDRDCQQHTAVMPQHYIFHSLRVVDFMDHRNGAFTT
jgi:hypothetical protein